MKLHTFLPTQSTLTVLVENYAVRNEKKPGTFYGQTNVIIIY